MTDLERALLHIKTRADAWAVKEVEKALTQECVGSTQKHVGNALDMRCDDAEQIDYHDDFATALKKMHEHEKRQTGKWIWCVGSHKCSNCEEYTCFSHKELLKYCPNCGAKMESEEI